MWQEEIVPWLLGGGGITSLSWIFYRLHRDAVAAERERADDWRAAAIAAEKRADVRDQQIATLLGRIRDPSS